jgi:hypothetical protein
MKPLSSALIELNDQTFVAENKDRADWEEFLHQVLSADFRIRRANGYVIQTKWEMIEQIRSDNRKRRHPTGISGGEKDDYGVVASVVTVEGDPLNKRYHNVKVFVRQSQSGEWQCVYWRVTELS